jgi:Leucine-rich repeat (LRR) protein
MKVDIGYSGGDKINDDDLVHFRSLPDVTELGLYEVPLTDKGIQHLSGLQKLQRLKLGNSKFTDAGLKIIGQLKNLEVFELGECENVTGAGLMHLKELTKMRELSLFYVEPGPGDLAFANDMLNLEAFHFVSNDDAPNESDLQVLGRLTKLSVLNLSGAGLLNNNTISHLSNLKSLTDLNLDYTSISDRAMQTVKEFTRLERLHLRGTRVDDLGMRSLAGMENLRELHLSGSKVGSRGISALADCPNLTELFLDSPETTDRHLAGLKDLKQLKKLYLSGDYDYTRKRSIPTRITLRGIQTLSVLEQLEQLHIKDNPQINDLAVPYLSKLKNLYVLKLEGTSITPQGGRKIADEIEGLDYDDLGL